jgi:hypothetical protein
MKLNHKIIAGCLTLTIAVFAAYQIGINDGLKGNKIELLSEAEAAGDAQQVSKLSPVKAMENRAEAWFL